MTTLSAFGIPLDSSSRYGSHRAQSSRTAMTKPRSRALQRAEVARLLERIEAQLSSDNAGSHQSSASSASKEARLAVSLYHAKQQLDSVEQGSDDDQSLASQGASSSSSSLLTSNAALRAKLQRLESILQSRQASRSSDIKPMSAKRAYLLRDALEDDEDEDDDDEEEHIDPRILARISKAPAPIYATKLTDEKVDNEDEDDMEAYETAASARRREAEKGGAARDREQEREGEKKSAEEEAPPTALQSDRSLQDSLSGELLRMAGALRANSLAFADALERDRKIVEAAGEKLEGNLTLMTRTRGKLGEYSKKARGMGWMTLASVATVCISWVIMFVIIKLT